MFIYVDIYEPVFCTWFSHGDISHTLKDFSVSWQQHYDDNYFHISAKQVTANNHKNHAQLPQHTPHRKHSNNGYHSNLLTTDGKKPNSPTDHRWKKTKLILHTLDLPE
jgi:hypothetical protein